MHVRCSVKGGVLVRLGEYLIDDGNDKFCTKNALLPMPTLMSRCTIFRSWMKSKASKICLRNPLASSSKGTISSSKSDWQSPPGALQRKRKSFWFWLEKIVNLAIYIDTWFMRIEIYVYARFFTGTLQFKLGLKSRNSSKLSILLKWRLQNSLSCYS